jgi:hypothetical protein
MADSKGFWRWYDRGGRVSFGGDLLGLVLDWKTLAVTAGGTVLSLFISAYGPWTPGQVWLSALVGGACLAIIYIALALFRTRSQKTDVPLQREGVESASGGAPQNFPDWPIHKLFSYINPNVLQVEEEGQPDPWKATSEEIRDKLALKRLRAWGRPVNDWASSFLEERPAMREIDASYWVTAGFSYTFFDETRPAGKPDTYLPPQSDLPLYADLHVNRAEAQKIWPLADSLKTSAEPPRDWKNVADAIEALAEPALIANRDHWLQKFQEALEKGQEAEEQIRKIRKELAHGDAADDSPEAAAIKKHRRLMEVAARQHDFAKDETVRAWDHLRADIHKKLCSGALIAKAFRSPHVSGNVEVDIPAAEWRILVLDNVSSEAITTHLPTRVAYHGVLIRAAS